MMTVAVCAEVASMTVGFGYCMVDAAAAAAAGKLFKACT
jgi:hypothetical protein